MLAATKSAPVKASFKVWGTVYFHCVFAWGDWLTRSPQRCIEQSPAAC